MSMDDRANILSPKASAELIAALTKHVFIKSAGVESLANKVQSVDLLSHENQ